MDNAFAEKTLPEFLSLLKRQQVARNSVFRSIVSEFEREGKATLPIKVTHVPKRELVGSKHHDTVISKHPSHSA